jgi:hypothetical protein
MQVVIKILLRELRDFLSASKLATSCLITQRCLRIVIKVTSSLANLLSHYSTAFVHCYQSNIIIIVISNSTKWELPLEAALQKNRLLYQIPFQIQRKR